MNTSLFILFSSGPHVLPGQPSNRECTPWKKSTMEGEDFEGGKKNKEENNQARICKKPRGIIG